ncbi:MAG: hypothetical protein ACI8VY_000511, partial [Cellvibrionaceae bacterium]
GKLYINNRINLRCLTSQYILAIDIKGFSVC